MKLQTGLLYRDQRVASAADLACLLEVFRSRKSEVSGQVIEGPLILAYRGSRVTPEEENERQPLFCGPYILTWDGRLDNREEMASRAGIVPTSRISDPFIVASAYASFGESAVADLVGEFAFCLWCRKTHTLSFVRSFCGTRPLYYSLGKRYLAWSTDFAHLARLSEIDPEVNEAYVAEYLITQPSPRHTPFMAISQVPPGSILRFQDDAFGLETHFWNPANHASLNYSTDQQYEEHCRQVLREAVHVRLRARHPIFAELSGGLDSSSIVLTADQILRTSGQSAANLNTLSCVYEHSLTGDEYPFIETVEKQRGISSFYVHENDQHITTGLREIEFTGLPNPMHCFPGRYQTYFETMRRVNARVLLTGMGGDHLFWSEQDGVLLVADLLRALSLLAAHRECRTWSRLTGVPYLTLLFAQALPLAFPTIKPARSEFLLPTIPSWLRREFRERAHSMVSDFAPSDKRDSAPAARAQLRMVRNFVSLLSAGYQNEYSELHFTHPYAHRPLVEFCLAVPLSQFLRNGETRSLMRRALKNLLPVKVARRKSKTLLDEAFLRALGQEWPYIGDVRSWQICDREYADPASLAAALNKMRLGLSVPGASPVRIVSLERWLRSLTLLKRNPIPAAIYSQNPVSVGSLN